MNRNSLSPSFRLDVLVDDAFDTAGSLQEWHADTGLTLRNMGAAATLVRSANQILDLIATEAHAQGASWTEIAEQVGISRQAARQRWAPAEEA